MKEEATTSKQALEKVPPKPPQPAKAKLSFKDSHALKTLPEEVDALADRIARLTAALTAPNLFASDPDRFAKLSGDLAAAEREKSEKEERWLELEMKREELEA